ncbi:glucosamine-6-phosphate deaminase [Terrarubrum flagellatum]|uniref:glucosamine-6-phosphate deaminase n=1 Tax=Terrirubrum flagellatum TaxID=2895980 RepID=UPI0031455EB6
MKVLICASAAEVVARAAKTVVAKVRAKPDAVLGLATGATFEPVYEELVTAQRAGVISFAKATTFNLDEYVGLPTAHAQSYRSVMRRCLFDHVDIDPARAHLPDGMASDPDAEADRYDALIAAAGGIDLQLLGIGVNGHIGFNEPSSSLGSRTRTKDLAPPTIAANSRYFAPDENMPRQSITMGIATIMEAREVLLVATGAAKAAALRAAIEGPVSAFCPASALQFHPRATALCDEEAASGLALMDYYRGIDHGE